ncbi:MAG: hypothetical protein QM504_02965 [Pseudomonadota bacterium]
MKKFQIIGLSFILLFPFSVFSCGTVSHWMDVYQKIESGNQWRDSMNQLESLVMLRSCGGRQRLKASQQDRLRNILIDAMNKKSKILHFQAHNNDIRNQVKLYKDPIAYNGLIESIFRRFNCLLAGNEKNNGDDLNKELYGYFGSELCSGVKGDSLKVIANNGGRLRASPSGRLISSLRYGIKLRVLGKKDEWFRVINPDKNNINETMIAYVHESIVQLTR